MLKKTALFSRDGFPNGDLESRGDVRIDLCLGAAEELRPLEGAWLACTNAQ